MTLNGLIGINIVLGNIFDKNINNGQHFCDFIKNKRNNYVGWGFYSRGFMLSELQHTSIFKRSIKDNFVNIFII